MPFLDILALVVPMYFVHSHWYADAEKVLSPVNFIYILLTSVFILRSNFLLPINTNFFKKGGNQMLEIHLTIFVKSAHTCRLITKKSQHSFGFGTFCFFCGGGKIWFLLWYQVSFTWYDQKSHGVVSWSKPH